MHRLTSCRANTSQLRLQQWTSKSDFAEGDTVIVTNRFMNFATAQWSTHQSSNKSTQLLQLLIHPVSAVWLWTALLLTQSAHSNVKLPTHFASLGNQWWAQQQQNWSSSKRFVFFSSSYLLMRSEEQVFINRKELPPAGDSSLIEATYFLPSSAFCYKKYDKHPSVSARESYIHITHRLRWSSALKLF